jgi:protein SCO1/2
MSPHTIRRLLYVAFAAVALLTAGLVARLVVGPSLFDFAGNGPVVIGGPLRLTDHTGRAVTDASYRGRFMLIYFGYTFCPDFCPTSLQIMAEAIDQLGPAGERVQPILITVDPERDTAAHLATYVPSFGPRMVGLTGSAAEIAAAARAYRVYYKKAKIEGLADYGMDHSSVIYLMGPDGKYLTHFTHQATPEQVAAGIRRNL